MITTVLNNSGAQIAPNWANGRPFLQRLPIFCQRTSFLLVITEGAKLTLCLLYLRLGVGYVTGELFPLVGSGVKVQDTSYWRSLLPGCLSGEIQEVWGSNVHIHTHTWTYHMHEMYTSFRNCIYTTAVQQLSSFHCSLRDPSSPSRAPALGFKYA